MINNDIPWKRHAGRRNFLDVIKCLRYLAKQAIDLQGRNSNNKFTQLLHLLGINDENIMKYLDGQIGYKYNHHESQNEMLNIMSSHVLRKNLSDIHECQYFTLIVDDIQILV